MNYKNSLYYTLSTIPQVLAAFIALSSVFVIFKMQGINKLLLFYLHNFYNNACEIPDAYLTILVNLAQLRDSESASGITGEMEKILNDNAVVGTATAESLKNIISPTKKLQSNKNAIMRLTYISILMGVPTIIYSLIKLSSAHSISENNFACVITLSISGAIISIVTMTIAIILCLKEGRVIKN